MDKVPFFTIGVPIYNAEKYLPCCLDSILSQSFSDFELILVNDGSKDNSLNICKAYQAKDARIMIIDQENGGVSAASNRILDHASGKYIYLMDNDDELYEGILQKAYDYLIDQPVDILCGGFIVVAPDKEDQYRIFQNDFVEAGFTSVHDFLEYETEVVFPANLWTKFVCADLWKRVAVHFQTKYDGVQDYDVTRRLMRNANTIRYVEDIFLTWYHPREGSISTEWSYSLMRNYCRLTADMLCEAGDNLSGLPYKKYEQMIIQNRGNSLWKLTNYTTEQQRELSEIMNPIRASFKPKYAPDKRTAFLFFAVKHFGARNAAIIISFVRKLKHIVLGR